MTPEEIAKLIVEGFNGHTFFMESMAQEWLEKRIAEGIRKYVEAEAAKWARGAKISIPTEAMEHDFKFHYLRGFADGKASERVTDEPPNPETDHPNALKEAVEKVSALVKKPNPRQKRSGPNWG